MDETFICTRCGQVLPLMERVTFDGQALCRSCCEFHTCLCDHCGKRIWAEDSCGDENYSLCRNCESRYYARCTDCGRLVLLGDLHSLSTGGTDNFCPECYAYRIRMDGVY